MLSSRVPWTSGTQTSATRTLLASCSTRWSSSRTSGFSWAVLLMTADVELAGLAHPVEEAARSLVGRRH